ncbi:MAG: rhodanese-like domain-containing protein [Bacteroidetes bacterium]|nr:rhodanese-like domain-containing protein [Bacteroidota bacterium]
MNKILVFMLVAAMVSCKTAATQKEGPKVLSTKAFAKQMDAFEAAGTDYVLLDIRKPMELVESGIISGAVNYDFYEDDFRSRIDKLDKDVPVMIYCRSGNRSGKSQNLFKELGFKEVYDLGGGMKGWLAAGKEVEK